MRPGHGVATSAMMQTTEISRPLALQLVRGTFSASKHCLAQLWLQISPKHLLQAARHRSVHAWVVSQTSLPSSSWKLHLKLHNAPGVLPHASRPCSSCSGNGNSTPPSRLAMGHTQYCIPYHEGTGVSCRRGDSVCGTHWGPAVHGGGGSVLLQPLHLLARLPVNLHRRPHPPLPRRVRGAAPPPLHSMPPPTPKSPHAADLQPLSCPFAQIGQGFGLLRG